MTGGTPSFRCERLSTRPARRNAHASFFCVVFAFLFSDVSISMGRRTAGAGSATGGPDANIRSWILLGGLAVRGSVTSRISTPTMMRRLSGLRQDIRDVWTCDNGRLHCYPVDRYNPLINIGTFGMPAQRELSSRQYPSAPVAVLKTSWSSIRKTEHQIVRNPPSTKRRFNITATR